MRSLGESKHVRVTKEVEEVIDDLRERYPDEYKTISDVMRAGVFALARWKEKDLKIQEAKKCTK